jgi:hypothetical protein
MVSYLSDWTRDELTGIFIPVEINENLACDHYKLQIKSFHNTSLIMI